MKNAIFLRNLILSLTIITSVVSGYYFYLLIDNPIDKDINKIFLLYKNKSNMGELHANLTHYALENGHKTMSDKQLITQAKTVCNNFQEVDNGLKNLEITSDFIKPYQEKFLKNTQDMLNLCKNPQADFYVKIGSPIEKLTLITTEMGKLKDRSYKLKNTIVDKYPVLSFFTFILLFLLILLLIKRPNQWVQYSMALASSLFIALIILTIGLNPLYSLIVLIMIVYIGFLFIALNRQSET